MKHLTIPCLQRAAVLLTMFAFLQAANAQVQTPKYVTTAINSHGYYEYLPQGYNTSGQNYPLLIFLHGLGELGDGSPYQLPKVLVNGPPRLINEGSFPSSFKVRGQSFSFIVISPQFTYWPGGNDVQSVIDFCVSHYRVDQSRIYVTGLSMGGGVTWDYASMSTAAANRVAAIVPVCGASDGNLSRGKILAGAGLAVWGLQNQYDPMVSTQNTIDWYNAINAPSAPYANPPMKMTIFPTSGHDAWSRAYDPGYKENGMNVYEWMLQYSRGNNAGGNGPGNNNAVASAGSNQTITLPVNQVTLDGSGSSQDRKYDIMWSKVSGPASYSFSDPTVVSPTVSNLSAGTYVFRITVSDKPGKNVASDDVTITVNPAPAPPPAPTFYDVPGTIEGENFAAMSGVQTEPTSDAGSGRDVGYIDAGDWMDYDINVTQDGTYSFNFRVAAPTANAQFQLKRSDGSVISTVHVPQTWSFQTWQNTTATIYLSKGKQTLRIQSVGDNWNFNRMQINSVSGTSVTPATVSTGSLHIEAENWSKSSGVINETTTDVGGGQDVGYIDPNDWMEYTVNVPATGSYTLSLRVASPANRGQFEIRNSSGAVLKTVNVPNTGGFQSWQTISTSLTLTQGSQTIRLVSTSPIWNNWNINWLDLQGSTSSTPSPLTNTLHIEAENYAMMSGVQTENTNDVGGGKDVDYIDPWDWMTYNVNIPQSGNYTVSFRVASPNSNSQLQLQADNGNTLANVKVPNTGSFQSWQTVTANVYLQKGQQSLKVLSTSASWNFWNFNWMDIAPAGNAGSRTSTAAALDHTVEAVAAEGLKVYPNPATDHVLVNISNALTGRARIQVLNMAGAVQMDLNFDKSASGNVQTYLSLQRTPPGSYILRVTMDNWIQTAKIVKQ